MRCFCIGSRPTYFSSLDTFKLAAHLNVNWFIGREATRRNVVHLEQAALACLWEVRVGSCTIASIWRRRRPWILQLC